MNNRRVVNKFPCNENGLVERFLGTAYDVVKEVWEEIPNIRLVLSLYEELQGDIDSAISQIKAEKNTALSEITDLGNQTTGEIQAIKVSAINEVEAKKLETLATVSEAWEEAVETILNIKNQSIEEVEQNAALALQEIQAAHALALAEVRDSTLLAKKWATHPINEEVEDGLYSSKHYAETAAAIVSTMAPVNWHPQVVGLDVSIPDNQNAWSAGPDITLLDGMTIDIGIGSVWTII